MREFRQKFVPFDSTLIRPSGTFSHREKGVKSLAFVLLFLSISNTTQVFSWNALGHRLITQIAYDNLTRHEKSVFNRYNRAIEDDLSKSLVNSSVWLDKIRFRTHNYDAMHYIDIPFSTDGTHLPILAKTNAISAIEHSKEVLLSSKTNNRSKGIALRILIHVAGDIHQPLHTTTRISWRYPDGDRGGNLVVLHKNKVARNLHAYWDKGAGLFVGKRRFGVAWVKHRAAEIENRRPCSLTLTDVNPWHWAQESHELAIRNAYGKNGDIYYQYAAQQIVEQRVAVAGCRLATLLHQICV